MTDGVIKSTGNSRYLKSVANFIALYPTYEDFAAALIRGDLPIDLNGINPNGWSQQATPLIKANLLSDSTGSMLGVGSTGTVNSALAAIAQYKNLWYERFYSFSYNGTHTYGQNNPKILNFPFPPEIVIIYQDRIRLGSDFHPGLFLNYTMNNIYWSNSAVLVKNQTQLFIYAPSIGGGNTTDHASVVFSGNTVKIASSVSPGTQFNFSGYTYYVIGIR